MRSKEEPPSLEPFISEQRIPPRPIIEPPPPRRRIPVACLMSIGIVGIIILMAYGFYRLWQNFTPPVIRLPVPAPAITTAQRTARPTATKRPTLPKPTITPTKSPTPIPLPFQDKFADGFSSEWIIFGDTPWDEKGFLKTGGITGISVGNNSWTNYKISTIMRFDCTDKSSHVGIGVRVQGIDKPMVWLPLRGCVGQLYATNLVGELSNLPYPQTFGLPDVTPNTTAIGQVFEVISKQGTQDYEIVLSVERDRLSLSFGVGKEIRTDLPQELKSGGVFFLLGEGVWINYIIITPLEY